MFSRLQFTWGRVKTWNLFGYVWLFNLGAGCANADVCWFWWLFKLCMLKGKTNGYFEEMPARQNAPSLSGTVWVQIQHPNRTTPFCDQAYQPVQKCSNWTLAIKGGSPCQVTIRLQANVGKGPLIDIGRCERHADVQTVQHDSLVKSLMGKVFKHIKYHQVKSWSTSKNWSGLKVLESPLPHRGYPKRTSMNRYTFESVTVDVIILSARVIELLQFLKYAEFDAYAYHLKQTTQDVKQQKGIYTVYILYIYITVLYIKSTKLSWCWSWLDWPKKTKVQPRHWEGRWAPTSELCISLARPAVEISSQRFC